MNLQALSRFQRGGTVVGFIAGVLVGLGIALVVAVYVTKVPVPLLDRGVQRPNTSEAVEAERNRNWNPNANLSTRPASPGAPTEPASSPAGGAVPSTPATRDDPIGQLIEQRASTGGSGVATVEAPTLVDPFVYYVQAGAFRNAEEAEAQRARLAIMGFEAGVTEREQAGRPVFRVRTGPFERRVDAELMEQRMQGQGVETALVRVQR
jgi:cell division protein FtsN